MKATFTSGGTTYVGFTGDQIAALPPADAAAGQKALLKARAADNRWSKQNGGMMMGSIALRTDEATRAALSQAVQAAAVIPNWSTSWKFADGTFGVIDGAHAGQMFTAVAGWMSQCFALELTVNAAITAGTCTTIDAVDAYFA